jgi:hypothetical protein
MIRVECPCGTTFEVADSYAGKRLRCPTCREYTSAGGKAADDAFVAPQRPAVRVHELPSKPPLERRPIGDYAEDRRDSRGGCVLATLCVVLVLVAVGAVAMWWWYLTGEDEAAAQAEATATSKGPGPNGDPHKDPQGKPPLYTVAFAVPSQVGDVRDVKVTLEGKGELVTTPPNGNAVVTKGGTGLIVFQGRVKTVAVDPAGYIAGVEITVVSLTERGNAVEQPGTVLQGEVVKGPWQFRYKTAHAGKQPPPGLVRLLTEASVDLGTVEDAAFGTRELKAVGDTWPINKAAAAQNLLSIGLPTPPEAITGEGKLAAAVNQAGTLYLDIEASMTMPISGAPKGAEGKVSREGTIRISVQARVPADHATGPVKRTTHVEAKVTFKELAGPRAGETQQKTDEETLTTETTYYRPGVTEPPALELKGGKKG